MIKTRNTRVVWMAKKPEVFGPALRSNLQTDPYACLGQRLAERLMLFLEGSTGFWIYLVFRTKLIQIHLCKFSVAGLIGIVL